MLRSRSKNPTIFLLTLVQGHSAQACGKSCPTGQAMSGSGRCVPSAVLARSNSSETERSESALAEPTPASPRSEQRIAAKPQRKKIASSWSAVVTPSAVPPAGNQATPPAAVTETMRPALPGRMAIGAPTETWLPGPTEQDRIKAEALRRKAELAAEDARRASIADAERRSRLTQVQSRNANGSRPPGDGDERKSPAKTVVAAAPVEADTSSVPTLTSPTPLQASPRLIRGTLAASQEKQANLPDPRGSKFTPQPARRVAARNIPPAYISPNPRPGYIPQPSRWTRTIFNDMNRMR